LSCLASGLAKVPGPNFKPATLVETPFKSRRLRPFSGRLLATGVSPAFLALLGKATLETLAMATAGLALRWCWRFH